MNAGGSWHNMHAIDESKGHDKVSTRIALSLNHETPN